MNIQTGTCRIADLSSLLPESFSGVYDIPGEIVERGLAAYLRLIRDDLWAVVEFPYVDRVYRDSYYNYFSSKNIPYARDCIRLSLFETDVGNLEPDADIYKVQEAYLGYIVIRPTPPTVMGRSMLSPRVLRERPFVCCLSKETTNVQGIDLVVHGFPHSSQDMETISCAETSVWSIMEYYGRKYAEYRPVLPSDIHAALREASYKRTLPSGGLTIFEISTALKKFGFSTLLYDRQQFTSDEFRRILCYYVESGIPIVVGLMTPQRTLGHAVIAIGHEEPATYTFDENIPSYLLAEGQLKVFDSADIAKKMVFINDNVPPFQRASFEAPGEYYPDPERKTYQITNFVSPLYSKMYIEASIAQKLILELLNDQNEGFLAVTGKPSFSLVLRLFLTSSRSFKRCIRLGSAPDRLKSLLLAASMPKFIWVAELSNPDLFRNSKIDGLVIIDATGHKRQYGHPFLRYYPGALVSTGEVFFEDFGNFDLYRNNLRGDWCSWES
jgi:hypothetical protein